MALHDEIAKEGYQAYRADRMAEAALLFRRAASAALELGNRTAWFSHTVWAALATSQKGDVQTGLSLLLEARQSEPEDAPQLDAWSVRKQLFASVLSIRPERARLEQLFTDLRSYMINHRVPAGDFPDLEGDLLGACGDWRASLACYEAAWQAYDGRGYFKFNKAVSAARRCLRLGQLASCRDWIAALDDCKEEEHLASALQGAELTLLLALAEGQPFPFLLAHLRTYSDRASSCQRYAVIDEVRELTARVYLLDPDAGDPAADFHPTRAELRRSLKDRQDVQGRYDAHLLHLDYRLACLRHAARVPAVDDYYYSQPQQVPARLTPTDPDQFQRRLHKARAAAQSTLRYARHLDKLLECDYRQREVQARSERIEEIALAVG